LAMSMELPSIDFAESMELSSAMSMESLSSAGVSSVITSCVFFFGQVSTSSYCS
jgi:hypothetical protein